MQLTKTQEGILNAEEIVGGAVSNICGAVFFTRQYSAEELNTAVNTVVRINDAFRLHFDRRTRTQWVEEYRWRDYDTVCFDTQADFERFAGEYAAAPLDTARALYDLKIVQIGGKTGLICVLHHMMCDAWSLSVLRWQLRRILEDKAAPPSFSFLEYCEEAQAYFDSRRFAGDRAYFLRQFHECKDRLPAVDPQPGDYQSGSLTFELAPGLREKISRCLERAGVSEYVLLLTAFGICYSRTRDCAGCFYIGTTVLNRTTEKDLHTIGPFINDIPLLFDLRDGQSAGEVLRDTDERVFNAFRHHRFNYPMLQEAIRGETPDPRLYDVIFNYQAEYETPDGAATAQWFRNGAQYETLQIHIDHRNDRGKRMITYNFLAERYTEKDIEKLHRHYMNVLESIITDDSRTVRDIPLMDEAEAAEIAAFSKGRPRPLPEKSLYDLIEEQQEGSIQDGEEEYSLSDLKRDAEKIDAAVRRREAAAGCLEKAAAAVRAEKTDGTACIKKTDNAARAEKTGDTACTKKTDNAARAEKTGAVVRAGKRVIGVICDRSYAELAAIYGIVRGGNAYLPIAPEFPPERINEILGISRCDTVLAQRKYRHLAKDALVIEEILDGSGPPQPLPAAAKPDDLLYVIFTSGSTGAPKGAMVSNRSAVNRILWMAEKYFTSETVVMLKTPYTFDVSVWEIFGFAVAGFKLYILPPYDHYRQDRVIEHICRGNVTDIHFVPSVFGSFLDALEQDAPEAPEKKAAGKAEFSEKNSSAETPEKKAAGKAEFSEKDSSAETPEKKAAGKAEFSEKNSSAEKDSSAEKENISGSRDFYQKKDSPAKRQRNALPLKNIFLSGESLPAPLVRRAPASVHNLYGPTECAVDVTYYDCTGTETEPVPIGYPIDNCRMYILDRNLRPVPAGVRGQICIAGIPVGEGYVHDSARTSEKFVPDPYGTGKMYLTGDIGYWNDAGAIVYVGRYDRQVKINGQRIEPEEIETAMMRLVPEAAVIVDAADIAERVRLTAFYTGMPRPSLRKEMSSILPGYMIPHLFVHLEEMPRTPGGKIDRKALERIPHEEREYEPPVSGTEKNLCALFSEVLHKERVGRGESFFDLGGTSLDLLALLCRPPLDKLSPPDFMTHSSPAELAAFLDRYDSAGALAPLYVPDYPYHAGIVLFPYAGGDASAFTALAAEFRKRKASAALYCLSWENDLEAAQIQIRKLSENMELSFYSHCAGSANAMRMLDQLNAGQLTIRRFIAGANIPPAKTENPWKTMPDQALMDVLRRAGMPELPEEQRVRLISRFRTDTETYFRYLRGCRKKSPCTVTLVLSRKDLFTQDFRNAEARWGQYVRKVDAVHFIDAPTHYFQSAEAPALADILLPEEV